MHNDVIAGTTASEVEPKIGVSHSAAKRVSNILISFSKN